MMKIRSKIILFTIAFLATSVTLGVGAFYIFSNLGFNLDALSGQIENDYKFTELDYSTMNFISSTEGWVLTRNEKSRRQYRKSLAELYESAQELEPFVPDKTEYGLFLADIEDLVEISDSIVSGRLSNKEIQKAISLFNIQKSTVFSRMHRIHEAWLDSTLNVVSLNESIRSNMTLYMIILIGFSLLSSAFLVIVLRRILGDPYRGLLEATEKVSSGDLAYRIHTEKSDEFGTIAKRFDSMVETLDQSNRTIKVKLSETELFLEIARIAGMTSELKQALDLIVETIITKADKNLCGIFILRQARNAFVLESCNMKDISHDIALPVNSDISMLFLRDLKPAIIEDMERYGQTAAFKHAADSLMLVPIVRSGDCIGVLMLGKKGPSHFTEDESSTAIIIAYTIGNAVKNIELYEATMKQLSQLRTVYELSKSLTSIFDPALILNTITSEITKLINAKGCIIRLLDGDLLKVESFSGQMEEPDREETIPLGKGIAGWVAKEGKPLFVEDVEKLPQELKSYSLVAKSAIAVPLKREETIIGTLALYDKLDESGEMIPFSLDDLAVAEGFASISAIAIDKMRMMEREIRSQATIMEAQKRMALLFESVQGGIITMDKDYTITSANKYVEKWLDKSIEDIISKNAVELFHGKHGICPHCVSRATFEYGETNSITQASGLNYAELSSYPIPDESGNINEAVVFIQDITERVLYQEEIMGLYREVMQTKEYIESFINNSADAIVTTDLEGTVKSWNPAATAVYGFSQEEVMGRFIPFIPDTLMAFEKENIERIKRGEVLKLETYRKKKDGSIIEVALTLSPIKDVAGEIIGISGISRDISDKKRVEKELIRRNQELSRLFFISSAMRGTLDLDRLLRMVLTAVTMSDGLGFNRSILFLTEEERNVLKGVMGVGPESPEEAWRIWEGLSTENRSLHSIMKELEQGALSKDSFIDKLSIGIEIPLDEMTALTKAVKEKKSFNIIEVKSDPLSDPILIQQLGTEAYAVVPLVSRDKVIGALWVDNLFNRKPITEEDMRFIEGFSDQVASAIEAARLFQKVSLAEAELENIFRSISDMVYITDNNYTIKNVNQAVVEKIGKTREEIVGRKCYEVFHGMDKPWEACPHHKTVKSLKSFVEEIEDPHLKGTFLTSSSPVFDSADKYIGTVHVSRDVSEMKQLREKLQSSERMAALGEVAAKVAHEIRNPLVSVGGFAKRLETRLTGNEQEYARIIANEVNRLEVILKDILGFVKDVRISRQEVDLNEVIKGIIDLLGEEFASRRNRIEMDLQEPSVPMFIDPDRIKDALINIITNANQATEDGSIIVKTYTDNGNGVLEVLDTGCGIRKDDMTRIFDPFFTTRPTGTGLGLAIAKRIIEEHYGNIDVDTDIKEKGARFIISLPLKEETDEDSDS